MIVWNGIDLIMFGLIGTFLLIILTLWIAEKLMFWLEKKNIISSKWRGK
jgi:uncharacterized SAM-binding protein YcdF (DUF218 family)